MNNVYYRDENRPIFYLNENGCYQKVGTDQCWWSIAILLGDNGIKEIEALDWEIDEYGKAIITRFEIKAEPAYGNDREMGGNN